MTDEKTDSDFDRVAERFTYTARLVADWKHSYVGAAYSTRIRQAITHMKQAIYDAEQHPELKP